MKKSIEELTAQFNDLMGTGVTSDASIEFLEDLTDSFTSAPETDEAAINERINAAVEDTERRWREKYVARFMSSEQEQEQEQGQEQEQEQETDPEEITIDELFEEKKEN